MAGATAARWEIVVPGWVPDSRLGLNGRREKATPDRWGRHRPKWKETAELEGEAHGEVGKALLALANRPLQPLERARVTVLFVFPNSRKRDVDNLSGRVKPCLDAIKGPNGLIVDDDMEHIELTIRAAVKSRTTETRIVVEPLCDGD